MSTSARGWRVAAFGLVLIAFIAGAAAQAPGEDYYIVDGKRVPLSPSKTQEAVAVKPAQQGVFMASAAQSPNVKPVKPNPILERYHIVLLQKKPAASFGAFASSVNQLTKHAAVSSDLPVYATPGGDQVLVNEFQVQFKDAANADAAASYLKDKGAQVVRPGKIQGRYLITFPDKKPREALAVVNGMNADAPVQFAAPNFVRVLPAEPDPPKTNKPAAKPGPQGAVGPSSIPGSSPPPSGTAPVPAGARVPNDPNYAGQWALAHRAGGAGVDGVYIGAQAAWKTTTGKSSVIIAIIDEGVDTAQPDLKDKIVTPYDAVDGDDDQQPYAWNQHGTRCSGVAGAVTNNALGVAGVSWGARIMPVRIAYSTAAGEGWITTDEIIEDGLRTAVDRGAQVLSNSWGGGTPSPGVNSAIDYALSKNRVVVFAAGNAAGAVNYPANLAKSKDIIAVAATNEWDEFKTPSSQDGEYWWGSNFGPEITLSAPGVHIATTNISSGAADNPDNYTSTFNGTSSATPLVAGAAALILSVKPNATPHEVKSWLEKGAKDLGPPGFDPQFGYGRLNAANALRFAINSTPPLLTLTLDPKVTSLARGNEMMVNARVTRDGEPVPGVSVAFSSADPDKASFVRTTALSDGNGVAQVPLRGEARMYGSVDITASLTGKDDGAPAEAHPSQTTTVKVPFMGWWTLLGLLTAGVLRVRRAALA